MQRQQETSENEVTRLQEEYRAAQRVAVESILVGRATSEVVAQQGEQLQRAESMVDDTQFKLDKATRLLKGMTWTGWANNLFSADVKAPNSATSTTLPVTSPSKTSSGRDGLHLSLEHYESLPSECQGTAQAIRNYHANVKVLMECETLEQKETCRQICDAMYTEAMRHLLELNAKVSLRAYMLQLQTDLEILRKHQVNTQSQIDVDAIMSSSSLSSATTNHQPTTPTADRQKEELFGRSASSAEQSMPVSSVSTSTTPTKTVSLQEQMQTEHLNVISACLGELGQIAQSLNTGFDQQRQTIDALDTKSENVLETSKMVGRRTERLVQAKSWTPAPVVYSATVAFRHVETGKYLAVLTGGDVYLMNKLNQACCVFDLHRRKHQPGGSSKIIGLRSHNNRKWIGQSFLTGSLTCISSQCSRREEWEMDIASTETSDLFTQPTRLLCVSAGWGNGGYLQVRSSDFAVLIGGSTAADSKAAAVWTMVNLETFVSGGTIPLR